MTWLDKQQEFKTRFDTLNTVDSEGIPQLITNLKNATARYIQKGGLNQDPTTNPEYETIAALSQKLEEHKTKYAALNHDILEYLKNATEENNLSELLTKNGVLQQQILNLQKVETELKDDVESAVARDELLRSRETETTSHRLFLLDRPVRRGMIPYLWVFGILFIGIGVLIMKMMFPLTMDANLSSVLGMVYECIANPMVLTALLSVMIVAVVFLSLKVANVI